MVHRAADVGFAGLSLCTSKRAVVSSHSPRRWQRQGVVGVKLKRCNMAVKITVLAPYVRKSVFRFARIIWPFVVIWLLITY